MKGHNYRRVLPEEPSSMSSASGASEVSTSMVVGAPDGYPVATLLPKIICIGM